MQKLYIMCGLPFAGKSTLSRKIAEKTGSKLVAFDELWVIKDKEVPVPKDHEGWKLIRALGMEEVKKALEAGRSVVYDENNAAFQHREQLREIARKFEVPETVVFVNTPMELIREREALNRATGERHEVEPANFDAVVSQLEDPTSEENVLEFKPDIDLETFLNKL